MESRTEDSEVQVTEEIVLTEEEIEMLRQQLVGLLNLCVVCVPCYLFVWQNRAESLEL